MILIFKVIHLFIALAFFVICLSSIRKSSIANFKLALKLRKKMKSNYFTMGYGSSGITEIEVRKALPGDDEALKYVREYWHYFKKALVYGALFAACMLPLLFMDSPYLAP